MRIAILIFGQPRFFNRTAALIKEEFTIPGWETDFFIHNWDRVGHTPECDQNEIFERCEYREQITKILQPKSYKIEPYKPIDILTSNILNSMNYIDRDTAYSFPSKSMDTTIKKERYYFGQHISIFKCYKEIVKYEEAINKQYDLIIKARTDIAYKPHYLYNSVEEYVNEKLKKYNITETEIPTCSVNALRINRLTGEGESAHRKKWRGEILTDFYLNKCITEAGESINYEWNYWERLCLNDWLLICNRKAATIYFSKWFENFFITMGKDFSYNKERFKWMSRSDHCMQGQLAINYNIKLFSKGKRRDRKIISEEIIKENIDFTGKILLKQTDDEKVLQEKIKDSYK